MCTAVSFRPSHHSESRCAAAASAILLKVKHNYEQFHHLEIPDEVIEQVVNLSDQYVKQRSFPDKALDLLDESCSWKKVSHSKRITVLKKQINDASRKTSEIVGGT